MCGVICKDVDLYGENRDKDDFMCFPVGARVFEGYISKILTFRSSLCPLNKIVFLTETHA